MKPYQQINKDLKALSELAIQGMQFADASIQVLAERRIKKILSRYYTKKRQYPTFRSIKN